MRQLSGTDSYFLSLEQPNWHQHLGGLTILDPAEAPDFDYLKFREILSFRVAREPKFMWKLHPMPLALDRPIWIDDDSFDIDHHLHHVALPAPGDMHELAGLVGRILSHQLDRRFPLWESWFVEGLPNGRVAIVMKYHHCLLDDLAGTGLSTTLLDLSPDAPAPPSPELTMHAGRAPSDPELLLRSLLSIAVTPARIIQYTGRVLQRSLAMLQGLGDGRSLRPLTAPNTPLNGKVGPKRRLGFCSVALDDVKAVKRHFDVKVNDVVLAIVSASLRSYLLEHGALPDRSLIANVPFVPRAAHDESDGDRVQTMAVALATDVAEPADRLTSIYASSQAAKEMARTVRATEIPSMGAIAPPAILNTTIGALTRSGLVSRAPTMANTVVSSVPGPSSPLFLGGARVTGIYASSIVTPTMGLNITLFSYLDRLDFGLIADPDLIPDVDDIAQRFPAALEELMMAAGLGAPTPVEDPLGIVA